jgi:ABC-type antimicrobial peptide transport system permease subunit
MSPTIYGNVRMAIASLKSAKMRSFLTMLGVIIGVVSVVTVVSIGEGIKHQVSREINQLGRDLITIRPGDVVQRSNSGNIDNVNLLYNTTNAGSLAASDIETVRKTPGVSQAVPLALVNGTLKVFGQDVSSPPLMMATTNGLNDILRSPVEFGEFFDGDLSDQPNVAVIGHNVANNLYGQRAPLGGSFEYLGQTFFVRGVMKKFDATPLSLTTDFNDVIFIPYQTAQSLTKNNTQLYEILAKPTNAAQLTQTVGQVTEHMRKAHDGQQHFSVLRQDESLAVTNNILDLLTKLIAGIAAISLLVGGIGIMDVMLVSVAERMHEIGLRKALGASNRQILLQFVTEASVLSLTGGILGIFFSLIINFILRVSTSLTPVMTWQSVVGATLVSLLVGTIFGTAPALKAARKDPIEALRNQ